MRVKPLLSLAGPFLVGMAAFATPAFAQTADTAGTPTAPYLVDADKISTGDTAWMLTSCALVLLMTLPGLALFYGGLVRRKNVLSVCAQCLGIAGLVTILWWAFGYSFTFAPGSSFLGGLKFGDRKSVV